MRRRSLALCALLGAVPLTVALKAGAQRPAKMYRVAILVVGSPGRSSLSPDLLREALRELGYEEQRNLIIESQWAEGYSARLPILAASLVEHRPDVIVTHTTDGALAAKQATTTIPIVMMQVSDPVGAGLAASLAQPRGNVTGLTDYGLDLTGKRVELIRTVAPNVRRVGVLMSDNPADPPQLQGIEAVAKSLGLAAVAVMDRSDDELEQAFDSLAKQGAGALIVLGGPRQGPQRARIAELALKLRIPTLAPIKQYVESGGLMSYGPNLAAVHRQMALYVAKILKGSTPAELPIEQPSTFELVINASTAKALGIALPQALLLRSDQLIQ
jgi:putative ABC transport system substrate-binding protein